VDSGIGGHLVQHVLEIPVLPVPGLDGRDLASQVVEQDEGDEVDEKPALHGLLCVHVEPVAVQEVLHVVEVQLDVAPAVVVPQSLGCILLCIGEDDPEPAVAVIDGLLVQADLPSPLGLMLLRYRIDQVSMRRYARRRNKAKAVFGFLRNQTAIESLVKE